MKRADEMDAMPNPLAGLALRYIIGADDADPALLGHVGCATEVPFDCDRLPKAGAAIGYCNLLDEENAGRYAPYLKPTDTAEDYDEGRIDPAGPGWRKNLDDQFARRKHAGFKIIELDNPDAYEMRDVIGALDHALAAGLLVVAKNPGLMPDSDAIAYLQHEAIAGVIVEEGAGGPNEMFALLRDAGLETLPCWFVFWGGGDAHARLYAEMGKAHPNMGVTVSTAVDHRGKPIEYGNSIDYLRPRQA